MACASPGELLPILESEFERCGIPAFFAGKKCVTILPFVVWAETMVGNRNILASPKAEDILEKLQLPQTIDEAYRPFGDGKASEKIVAAMEAAERK